MNSQRDRTVSDRKYIETLFKTADLYKRQGLCAEAREKYLEIMTYVHEHQNINNLAQVKKILERRIRLLEENVAELEGSDLTPDLPKKTQDLIKRVFSFSGKRDVAAVEGAVALMRFGQYRRALDEFEGLLNLRVQPLLAAKNIITCLLLLGSPEMAISRFKQWSTENGLSDRELMLVRVFLESALLERGVKTELPFPIIRKEQDSRARVNPEGADPEISVVAIEFEKGLLRGQAEELRVTFQFGNVISVIVPSSRKDLLDSLRGDTDFYRMGFYSPMAYFKGTGRISNRCVIKHGPRKGDYLLDIAIDEK